MKKYGLFNKSGLMRFALALLIAFVFLCFFSKNSFLYPMNDWVDENCFFTLGRSILQGKVPYRDICEQKGPIVYFVFAVAALISKTSFIGAFIIELLLFAAFLYVGSGYLKLYRPHWGASSIAAFMLLLSFAVTISISFSHGGSVEELSLFMHALSLLFVLEAVKMQERVKRWQALLIGAFAAIALFSKFTLLGFYLGLFAAYGIYLLRKKALSELLLSTLFAVLGAALIILPILLYFAANNALHDLFETYFLYNIKLYPINESGAPKLIMPFANILRGFAASVAVNGLCSVFLALGAYKLVRGLKKHPYEAMILAASYAALMASSFIGGRSGYSYYALITDCFAPLGVLAVLDIPAKTGFFSGEKKRILRVASSAALAVLLPALGFVMSRNTYLLKYGKKDMPQYIFAETITKKQDSTMLNYGFLDGGFYFAADRIPPCKYFCKLNLRLAEMNEEQKRMIEERRVDFIITRSSPIEESGVDCSGYVLVDTASFPFEGKDHVYYLYELKADALDQAYGE